MISDVELRHWFTYHAPGPGDNEAYAEIRLAGLALARAIVKHSPPSADQTAAVRKVREAVMSANQARACQPQVQAGAAAAAID